MWSFSPETKKRLRRFRSLRRGYYALIVLVGLLLVSLVAELWVSNRALLVRYQGRYFFPTYGAIIPGSEFGLDYSYETKIGRAHV